MGIEPTLSAWKAEVLPLNYTRAYNPIWWRGKDSNLRRQSRQIYSLIPLAAWVPLPQYNATFSHDERIKSNFSNYRTLSMELVTGFEPATC